LLEQPEQTVEHQRGDFCISTDKTRLNIDTIHTFPEIFMEMYAADIYTQDGA
jgi:hypothetical protein